jgi:thymidylate kinase
MTPAAPDAAGADEPTVALDDAFAALGAGGRAWCLLRPPASAFDGGDIDILVAPAPLADVRRRLPALGFTPMPIPGEDLHVARPDSSGGWTWLHVQGALLIAGERVPAGEVLRDVDPASTLRVAPDPWLLWILLLRALVDKGDLPARHRASVQALARAGHRAPAPLAAIARRWGLPQEELLAEAAAGDWDALLRHRIGQPPAAGPAPRERAAAIARALTRPPGRRGLIVAILGPDGAGKTTLIGGLEETLPLPVRVQYMGLTGGRLPRADALRVPGLVLAARLVVLWARWLRSAYHRGQGRIVLCDRYTLDGTVPSGARLGPLGKLSRRVQSRALPAPDLVLLLDASGATMHARKGEYDPDELERWRAAYARLRRSVRALEVIDAERPAAAVLATAQAAIWRRLAELARPG